jgi:hypothetical protein
MPYKTLKTKRIIKPLIILLVVGIGLFGVYAYKLHALAVEGNKLFEYRCTDVNPHLIGYKKSFLLMADYFNDPEDNADLDVGKAFEDYNSGLKSYVEAEDKWLAMQKVYIERWDFKLIEPWYIKQAAELQWKMYEGYRDDTKYLVATYDAGGLTEDIDTKFTEARDRRDKYEGMYYDFFDEASQINDWRKIFTSVPVPEGCTEENMTIPDISGSIDWDGSDKKPMPSTDPADYEFAS